MPCLRELAPLPYCVCTQRDIMYNVSIIQYTSPPIHIKTELRSIHVRFSMKATCGLFQHGLSTRDVIDFYCFTDITVMNWLLFLLESRIPCDAISNDWHISFLNPMRAFILIFVMNISRFASWVLPTLFAKAIISTVRVRALFLISKQDSEKYILAVLILT